MCVCACVCVCVCVCTCTYSLKAHLLGVYPHTPRDYSHTTPYARTQAYTHTDFTLVLRMCPIVACPRGHPKYHLLDFVRIINTTTTTHVSHRRVSPCVSLHQEAQDADRGGEGRGGGGRGAPSSRSSERTRGLDSMPPTLNTHTIYLHAHTHTHTFVEVKREDRGLGPRLG